jgi:hypothetical protein
MKKNCKIQVPMVDIAMVDKICYLLDSFIFNNPQQSMLDALEYWFLLCVGLWGLLVGGGRCRLPEAVLELVEAGDEDDQIS